MKGRALAWRGFDVDPASMLMHNALNCREAHAGSLANFLGGEKRLEKVPCCIFIHPDARIGNGDTEVRTRGGCVRSGGDAVATDLVQSRF